MKTEVLKNKLPALSIIAAASLWGIIGIFVRSLSDAGFSSMQLVAIRTYITAAVLIIYLAIFDRKKLKINIKDSLYFVGTGIISFAAFNFCYFTTIGIASMATASILLYTAPIIVMVMSVILFREELNKAKIISLFFAVSGCIMICGLDGTHLSPAGMLIGICSGFCYALYSIFARYALKKYSSITVTVYTFVFASIGVIPFADFPDMLTVINNDIGIIAKMLSLGIISSTLPYLLYTWGLAYTDSGKASVMATVEPAVATLTGIFIFKEAIGFWGIIGIVLVFMSVILLNKSNIQKYQKNVKKIRFFS